MDAVRRWFTSSHSSPESANCVEVGLGEGMVFVRDSVDPAGPVLGPGYREWVGVLRGLARDPTSGR